MPDTSKGFEDAVLDRILSMVDPMVDGMAGTMGMPPGAKKYSQREIDELWNASPIADPDQRARTMFDLYHQGVPIGEITDQVYPNRRKVIETSRPNPDERIQFAQQQDRRMARMARDLSHHVPGVEPWASITQENAPPEPEQTMPGQMIDAAPVQATSTPGWADPGGQFGLTGPQV